MNNKRRKELKVLCERLNNVLSSLDVHELDACLLKLGYIKDDEEYYYDHIPENLLYSTRGEQSESAISYLDDAISILEDIFEDNDEVLLTEQHKGCIEDAIKNIKNSI